MDERKQRSLWRTIVSICSLALVLLVLSACTVGGDDDEGDATEEPTETVAAAEISTPSSNVDPEGTADSTPSVGTTPAGASTVVATPDAGGASPTPEIVVSAPPVTVPAEVDTDVPAQASPQPDATSLVGVLDQVVTGGDETTDFQESTPVLDTTGVETTVTSCEGTAPPLEGGTETYVTTSDVNFRNGPGTDCESIGEPLGEGAVVEVLSEPVIREGDDEYLWVAVSIDGTEGWLATEFLEPAE